MRHLALLFSALFSTLLSRLSRGPRRPSWSFTFETVLRYLRSDWEATADWDLARLRRDHEARPYPQPRPKDVFVEDSTLGGVPVRWFRPAAPASDTTMLYLHGGSYFYGSTRGSHHELVLSLARRAKIAVAGLEYRLAPEHPFPAQLEDALASCRALRTERPARRVIVGGDSAGGNLAVELAIALRDAGDLPPDALVLLSPWADLTMPGRSFVENDRYEFGRRVELVRHAAAYAGAVPLTDPRISPTFADLRALPPSFVQYGEVEAPRDDIVAFAARLAHAGNDVTSDAAPDMPHNPSVFAAYHPSGEAARAAIVRFLERHR